MDMELKLVGAITPTPAFRALLQCAVRKSRSDIVLISPDEAERLDVWSWWRRGRIHLPQLQTGPVMIPHRVPTSCIALAYVSNFHIGTYLQGISLRVVHLQ